MASVMMDEKSLDVDKLSYEIFSILESKFLFSNSPPEWPLKPLAAAPGKIRILSIDAASDGGILAALTLSRLETLLKKQTADPGACVADYFDIVAGSGAGGILAAMLFTRGGGGQDARPLLTAEESLQLVSRNRRKMVSSSSPKKGGGIFGRCRIFRKDKLLKKMFTDATLHDAIKPLLISCFDLLTGSPFMFSRSDAVESDGFNFLLKDICAATCADTTVEEVQSVDGKTNIRAVGGGGVGMGNPTAAAITHVLNNKTEFPFADGPQDLLVVSLGTTEAAVNVNAKPNIARIAGEGATYMVDQSVAMAFGQNSSTNYVRIQANGLISETKTKTKTENAVSAAEMVLSQRHIESVMFRSKKISDEINAEKIERVSRLLIQEQDRRKKSNVPTVVIKPAVATPRTSSATTATTATVASTATSASLS